MIPSISEAPALPFENALSSPASVVGSPPTLLTAICGWKPSLRPASSTSAVYAGMVIIAMTSAPDALILAICGPMFVSPGS